jgi:hypothetical protein
MMEPTARDFCGEALAGAGIEPSGGATSERDDRFGKSESGPQPDAGNQKDTSWPTMDEAAYYGLAGDIERTIAPHTEADPAAILIQFLVYFGNVVGNSPYYLVEADKHHANLFAVLVGQSAKGRKGTSGGRVRALVKAADERWIDERMKNGLSSGEGLINEVHDEIKKWDPKEQQQTIIDPRVADKRLMLIEPEFANALAVMERPGNTLSPTTRNAWDGHKLSTLTKNSPLTATGAHISIVGHITEDELRARITARTWPTGLQIAFCSPAFAARSCCLTAAT